MAAVCRDIAEGWGEDISFEGQYLNATDWFRILRENAAEREQALLEKSITAEELAKDDPCILILLQILAE
ncbi:MAG: hypothetical protein IJ375_02970 [Oscillospiraceae bacterium]|nr:hypothetical protein [Oscillospiraceae bacterium]